MWAHPGHGPFVFHVLLELDRNLFCIFAKEATLSTAFGFLVLQTGVASLGLAAHVRKARFTQTTKQLAASLDEVRARPVTKHVNAPVAKDIVYPAHQCVAPDALERLLLFFSLLFGAAIFEGLGDFLIRFNASSVHI